MIFTVENIKIEYKHESFNHFSWIQRKVIKWFNIEVEKKFSVKFIIKIYKHGYLETGMFIRLNPSEMTFRITYAYPDNHSADMIVCQSINEAEIKLILASINGVDMFTSVPEGNFKRIKYPN